jgi:RNA polymerase sigma-70 factor (ECF subfamily)
MKSSTAPHANASRCGEAFIGGSVLEAVRSQRIGSFRARSRKDTRKAMQRRQRRDDYREHRSLDTRRFPHFDEAELAFPPERAASAMNDSPSMPSEVFEEIYSKYAPRMRQVALGITRNEADAEDAVQDAFLRIYEKYGTFRHQSSLWTWAYRVTQTSALMMLRRNRASDKTVKATGDLWQCKTQMNDTSSPEQVLVQSRMLDAVQEGVDELIPSLRSPMNAYLREGLNQEDLCKRYRLTTGAVKARMHRARTVLRKRLRQHLAPGA